MKKPTLLLAGFVFIFAALLLTSCSLEKRHYRKGYFVQQASGKFQQHGPAIQPIDDQINFAVIAPSETAGFHDTTSTPTLVGTSGCRLKDSSIGEEHLQPVGVDIRNVNESVALQTQAKINFPTHQPEFRYIKSGENYGGYDDGKIWFWILLILVGMVVIGVVLAFLFEAWGLWLLYLGFAEFIALIGTLSANRKNKGAKDKVEAKKRSKRRWVSVLLFLVPLLVGITAFFVALALAWG
jgi:hypothetical protein